MKKKLQAGFTLTETLVTVALLGIVFLAVAGGIVVFQRSYTNVTRKANAQVLLSTSIMEVTNDLRNAKVDSVVTTDGAVSSFYTSTRGYEIKYMTADDKDQTELLKGIQVCPKEASSTLQTIPLVTDKTNTEGLYTKIVDLKFEDGVFTFSIFVYDIQNKNLPIEKQEIVVRPNNE